MAAKYEVRCINKPNRLSADEHIIYLGGTQDNGRGWKFSQEEVIKKIEAGNYFYVNRGGNEVRVIVVNSSHVLGNKYLRTSDDGISQNNLLNLPECPSQGLLAGLINNSF